MNPPIDVINTRKRVRKGLFILFNLAQAIDHMPDSDSKIELIAKHQDVLEKLNGLQVLLSDYDPETCWYSLEQQCPGCSCWECPAVERAVNEMLLPSVEEFDANRVANAQKYYASRRKEDAPIPF